MELKWDKSLEIGHLNIDKEHEELLERINYFFNSINSGVTKMDILRILDFLERYVEKHFADEEEIQRNYDYPKQKNHCFQHQIFRNNLQDMRYIYDNFGVTLALTNYMQQKIMDYWKYHVSNLDKDLGEYLKKNPM